MHRLFSCLRSGDARPPQAEVAHDIVERATDALALMPFEKMHPETLLKIIDRLTAIYGTEKEETRVCKKSIRRG